MSPYYIESIYGEKAVIRNSCDPDFKLVIDLCAHRLVDAYNAGMLKGTKVTYCECGKVIEVDFNFCPACGKGV